MIIYKRNFEENRLFFKKKFFIKNMEILEKVEGIIKKKINSEVML